MGILKRTNDWLETHWVTPAYAGWLLGGIAVSFFGAATNTMAGWLYVMSGVILAILGIAAILPRRSLRQLSILRHPIEPVSVGDDLTLELDIKNPTSKPKTLIQVQDILPYVLGTSAQSALEVIPPQSTQRWTYYQPTTKRGIYRWDRVDLRTATPLGLFWCRRSWEAPATAIVYPTVLPLVRCPLVDEIGKDNNLEFSQRRRSQASTEGITRALRPYRVGDPTRLIHWRTSARYGDLKVRELEVITAGQEVVICLDSGNVWEGEDFENAVIAAASLYFYAGRHQLNVSLWTATTGLLSGNRVVLETLAAVNSGEEKHHETPTNLPLIWLTQNSNSLATLPFGSRWVLWQSDADLTSINRQSPGLIITPEPSLQQQLQQALK